MLPRQWILFCFAVLIAGPNADAQDPCGVLEQPVGVETPSVDHQPSSTCGCAEEALPVAKVALRIEMLTPIKGTERWDWWQARTAQVPGEEPLWITTMSETGKKVSHDFHDIYQTVSRDGGKNWSEPTIDQRSGRAILAEGGFKFVQCSIQLPVLTADR